MSRRSVHPVFYPHVDHLARRTLVPRPGSILHAINRRPSWFRGEYIVEPEHIFAISPKSWKRNMDPARCLAYAEHEVESGDLKQIVFQSEGALRVARRFMTAELNKKACVVQLVPPTVMPLDAPPETNTILMITGRPTSKGLFLVPEILDQLQGQHRLNVRLVCVAAHPFPPLQQRSDVEFILTPRLGDAQRQHLYQHADVVLNLSLMESLGIYLESIAHNRPMVTLQTQHAPSYIDDGRTGFVISTPIYFLSERFGRDWRSEGEFVEHVRALHARGGFEATTDSVVAALARVLGDAELRSRMRQDQHAWARKHLTIERWLQDWSRLYHSLS